MDKSLNPFGKLGKSFKKLPPKYRLWVSAGILVALLVALPITLLGFLTGTFELRKRAVTGEPTPVPSYCEAVGGVIDVTPAGGLGTCHDIQTAIDAAQENEKIHVHAGYYEIPIQERDGQRIGLYINKKIFFEGDYPNTRISIMDSYMGILFDGVDVSLSGWRVDFRNIGSSGIQIRGNASDRYVYLGVLDLYSLGAVPRLVDIYGVNGILSSGDGRSGIFDSRLWGAEYTAIDLGGVDNFDVSRNEISHSTQGIYGYSNSSDLQGINIEENKIHHVRAGIVIGTSSDYRVRDTYLKNNTLYDFGYPEYYSEEAERYGPMALGGINVAYSAGVGISSNTLVDSGGIGIMFQGGGNVIVEKNLLVNNSSSVNMSGGSATFINNTFDGNPERNGGGVSITKESSFINNIVTNVASYVKGNVTADQCGLIIEGSCDDFSNPGINHNDFWNNERIYCTYDNGQCPFTYGENGNIFDDPLFGENYCLLTDSPAIYGDVGLGEHMGHVGPCEAPLPPTPTPATQTLQFTLKFEGVTSRPLDDSDKQVQIYATSGDGGAPIGSATSKETVTLSVDDSGVYHGEITLTSAFGYYGFHYRLRVKGPKHLQAVFPDVVFQEGVELDLTSQTLRPGDLNIDGRVDKNDLQLINERMFSTDPVDVALADVNFDNRVDIIDRTLVLNTLSVYYDPD